MPPSSYPGCVYRRRKVVKREKKVNVRGRANGPKRMLERE
tara:strand:+ start:1626 stop:1745 length:120 start_codon:yes stop_codon:yes gene_type:complete